MGIRDVYFKEFKEHISNPVHLEPIRVEGIWINAGTNFVGVEAWEFKTANPPSEWIREETPNTKGNDIDPFVTVFSVLGVIAVLFLIIWWWRCRKTAKLNKTPPSPPSPPQDRESYRWSSRQPKSTTSMRNRRT